MHTRSVLSVSDLTRKARRLLEEGFGLVWLEAEISNFTVPASGHWYFSLKDEAAQVRAACFRNRNQLFGFRPKNGDKVLVRARVTLYEARGEFQLAVEFIEPAGRGLLQQQFEALKLKLQQAGLFDATRKRPLPPAPRCIAVITSPTGAAIHDVLTVLRRRAPQVPVIIYPAKVQGDDAAASLIQALQQANRRQECDVVLLTRGGGSLEDLYCFNDEALALAIARSEIPVISAVGHEVDFSIADWVADVRAPTPSAAAEMLVSDKSENLQRLRMQARRLQQAMQQALQGQRNRYEMLQARWRSPEQLLQQRQLRRDDLARRMELTAQALLQRRQQMHQQLQARLERRNPALLLQQKQARLQQLSQSLQHLMQAHMTTRQADWRRLAATLNAVSPLATLTRGYSVTSRYPARQLIDKDTVLHIGEQLETRLHGRRLLSTLIQDQQDETSDLAMARH